jgi:hypothetical protein
VAALEDKEIQVEILTRRQRQSAAPFDAPGRLAVAKVRDSQGAQDGHSGTDRKIFRKRQRSCSNVKIGGMAANRQLILERGDPPGWR